VRKILVCTAVLAGLTAAAHAADLSVDSVKDALPPIPDGPITWHGVTLYGTIDAGYAYQTNGRPLGYIVSDLEYMPFGLVTRNLTGQPISTLTGSALEQSKIGLKIEEDIGYGLQAVGRLDTGFDPMTGELSDGCKSLLVNSGIPYAKQTSNSDSARCGQAFNNVAYGGLSSSLYGTLTVGRQLSLQLDTLSTYDPMSLSYAFSVLGFSGAAAGMGSTQASRWDDSVKYVFTYGPFHAAGMYTNGGSDTGIFGDAYGANVGFTYRGFSLDGVWSQEHGVVNLQSAANNLFLSQTLAVNISDNEGWTVAGKYTFEFGDGGLKDGGSCGGLKDAACPPPSKLTFFAGYTHTDNSNPRDPVHFGNTQGGYPITVSAANPVSPDNDAFTTDRIYQSYWTGAKYELPSGWSFTAAYYHIDQNSYVADNRACPAGGASGAQCAGSFNQGAFLIDYAFNKHLDVYGGVTYARSDDGLASGFQGNPAVKAGFGVSGTGTSVDIFDFATGVRLRF
jgi:predicted porin